MNKLALGLSASIAMLAAVPASAQYSQYPSSPYGGTSGSDQRIAQMEMRLQDGISNGTIDRTEARDLRQQLRQLSRLERQYSRDGLSSDERRDLQQRIRFTRDRLRMADGGTSRYAEWNNDYSDRYVGYGAQNFRQVSEVCGTRTGLSGVLGAVFGSDNCLRTGERAPSGLSAVPTQYRNQFADRSDYYHRYVNGNIVRIDSRTGRVSQIFDVFQSASR